MVVVDTSVWVDVLNENDTPQAALCIRLLREGAPLALTNVILTETLQGLRSDTEARQVEDHLRTFPILRLESVDDFSLAASFYRQARRAGVTIRKTLDCLRDSRSLPTGGDSHTALGLGLRPSGDLHPTRDFRAK